MRSEEWPEDLVNFGPKGQERVDKANMVYMDVRTASKVPLLADEVLEVSPRSGDANLRHLSVLHVRGTEA